MLRGLYAMRYPAGIKRRVNNDDKKEQKDIRKVYSQSHSNRGMLLEEDLNETNDYYNANGKAVIHKKPTPIQVVSVGNKHGGYPIITKAFFQSKSTTDYNGVYRGKYVDFEAKETKNKTSFPLSNFHEHQIRHMEQVIKQDGICFCMIRFTRQDETYLVKSVDIIEFYNEMDETGNKSIPYKTIKETGVLIPFQYNVRLDYLKVVDELFFE